MRTLIDIEDKLILELDRLAKSQGRSRASAIREAVTEFLRSRGPDSDKDAYGLWGARKVDGQDYQQKVRDEW